MPNLPIEKDAIEAGKRVATKEFGVKAGVAFQVLTEEAFKSFKTALVKEVNDMRIKQSYPNSDKGSIGWDSALDATIKLLT